MLIYHSNCLLNRASVLLLFISVLVTDIMCSCYFMQEDERRQILGIGHYSQDPSEGRQMSE